MKKAEKFVALLLALIMVFTLCACGKDTADDGDDGKSNDDEYIYIGYDVDEINFPDPANPMNPKEIYKGLDYTPVMLGGWFEIEHDYADQFKQDYSYVPQSVYDEYKDCVSDLYLSSVPYEIVSGASALAATYEYIYLDRTHDWAILNFYREDGCTQEVLCTVTVDGSIVSYSPVSYYAEELDENYDPVSITYQTGDKSIDYTFERDANSITLTSVDNGESITLSNGRRVNTYSDSFSLEGIAAEGSPTIENINGIDIYRNLEESDSNGTVSYSYENENFDRAKEYASVTLGGLFNIYCIFTANGGHETEFKQSFVYLDTGYSCILIGEAGTIYYYTESNDTTEDQPDVKITEVDDAVRLKMEQHRSEILDKLVDEMQAGGIDINVNYETGEVSLDAGILFDVNAYDISNEGKATLDKFIGIYTDVIFSDEFSDWVSRIVVEGHTDTNGDYNSNMTLSENRANSVLDYCLSCPSCSDYKAQMTDMMSALGMSYDRPVYNDDGSVNMDASRRVSFRIVISLAGIEE